MSATGYALILTPDRAALLEDRIEEWEFAFAEAVPEFTHSRNSALTAFISTQQDLITHIAEARRGVRAGTDQRRLNLNHVHTLTTSVSIEEILQKVPVRTRKHLQPRLRHGGLLPPKSFQDVVSTMMSLTDELNELLKRYGSERRERISRLSGAARQALAQQKEALSGALKIANINRTSLLDWTPARTTVPESYLSGLQETRLLEDNVVRHDQLMAFPGFSEVRTSITGVAHFESEDVILEVLVANKTPLETQTGADLIYYNATFDSFVLVQYKMMEVDSDDSEAIFRLPNKQLAKELSRMDQILAKVSNAVQPSQRDHFRLRKL